MKKKDKATESPGLKKSGSSRGMRSLLKNKLSTRSIFNQNARKTKNNKPESPTPGADGSNYMEEPVELECEHNTISEIIIETPKKPKSRPKLTKQMSSQRLSNWIPGGVAEFTVNAFGLEDRVTSR